MKKETRPIASLRLWDKNPRAINKDKYEELKERIKKWGQFKPLVITKDGKVLGGNMRLKAYQDLGINDIWVSVVYPKNEAEEIEIALADNEEMGFYQEQELAEIIYPYREQISLERYSVHLGKKTDLSELLGKIMPNEIIEDEVPEVPEEPISKYGEVYELGRHRLMCGDSTKIEDVEKLMNGQKADMVFTDPPYGVYDENWENSVRGVSAEHKYNDDIPDYYNFTEGWLSNLIMNEYNTIYVWINGKNLIDILNASKKLGYKLDIFLVWVKDRQVFSRLDYMPQLEICLYGWSGKHKFYGKNRTNVLKYDKPHKSELHPTMKPIELCADLIKDGSKQDDIVLDLFGGSGSTLIACEQLDRTCYMMELDPKYCDVIRQRYENYKENNKK